MIDTSGRRDISLLRMADRSVSVWLQDAANEAQAVLSPDGKWVAYISDDRAAARCSSGRSTERAPVGPPDGSLADWCHCPPMARRRQGAVLQRPDRSAGVRGRERIGECLRKRSPERLPIQAEIGVVGRHRRRQRVLLPLAPQASLETPITVS